MSEPAISIEQVSWAPRGLAPIIEDVSLTCAPGTFTALIGPNGSGKSTLLKLLTGEYAPTAGRCVIKTATGFLTVARTPRRHIAQQLAVMAQHSNASMDLRAHEVVALGRIPHQSGWARPAAKHDPLVEELIASVSMQHRRSAAWSTLSGGERQKIQLARALAQQSPILVMDEPTNHLDPAAAWELLALVKQQQLTVVAALHDLNMAARFCDQLAVMHGGRLITAGTPADVLTETTLNEVFGMHCQIGTHPDGGPIVVQTGSVE